MTATIDRPDIDDDAPPRSGGNLRVVLLSIIAVAALVLAGTVGWLLHGGSSSTASMSTPTASSVDTGFAQDMSTHHTQAVTMAGYERDYTTNPALHTLAFDIETSQQFQVGEMQGWLDSWGMSRNNPHQMAWMGGHMSMGADGLMPGMATPAQMDKLAKARGKALDILFLQLMIHHHQGGVAMARYAAAHADETYVQDLAQSMVNAQSSEIIVMEQALRKLGASPLPPPQTS